MNKLLPILLVVVISGCGASSDNTEVFYATCEFKSGTESTQSFIPKVEIEYSTGFLDNKFLINGFEASSADTDVNYARGEFNNSDGSSHKMLYEKTTNVFHMEDLDKHGKTSNIWKYKCHNKYFRQKNINHPNSRSIQWSRGYSLGYFNALSSSQLISFDNDFKDGYLFASSESACHDYMIVGEWKKYSQNSCSSYFKSSMDFIKKQGVISPNAVTCIGNYWNNCLGYTSTYYGKFKNKLAHGFGRMTFENGFVVGSFANGILNGRAIESFHDGSTREATWVKGMIEGDAVVKKGNISSIYQYKNGKLINKKDNTRQSSKSNDSFKAMFQLLDLLNRSYY